MTEFSLFLSTHDKCLWMTRLWNKVVLYFDKDIHQVCRDKIAWDRWGSDILFRSFLYRTALPRLLKASYTITLYSKFFVFVVLSDLHSNLVRQIQLHWQMTKQSLLVKDKFKVHICKLTAAGFTLQKLCHCMSSKVLFVVFLFKTLWVLKKINPSSTIYSLFFSSQI